MSNIYDIGDLLPVEVTFTNANGQAIDPTAVNFQYTKPDGTETTTTYGGTALPAITKTSTGRYATNLNIDQPGPWYYRWYSTGTGQTAQAGHFDAVSYKP